MSLTLSERAEHVRDELYGRYDRMNELWLKAEQKLAKHHIPKHVIYEYHTDEDRYGQPHVGYVLGLFKVKGEWKISAGSYCYNDPEEETDWKPIAECSATTRTKAAKFLPAFEEAIIKSAERFVPEVDDAIQKLDEFVNQDIESLLAERAKLNGKAK
jgi:hypothetical protein